MMHTTCYAILTARAGSKGIPGKNMALLGGRPLIDYSIEAAQKAQCLQRTLLSSDDAQIIAHAQKLGVEVPFLRPSALATDTATHVDVLLHALAYLEEAEKITPDWLVLLQPTSPLRTSEDIDNAILLAVQHQADAVISVTPMEQHPYLAKRVSEEGQMHPFFDTLPTATRRQDFPACYRPNGAVYVLSTAAFKTQKQLYMRHCFAYIMPPERSVDIDTPMDLKIAEALLR